MALPILLGVLVLGMSAELGRRVVTRLTPSRAVFVADTFAPEFKVGDRAPDFASPDRSGRRLRLSEFTHAETLLCFTCGCARCRDLQSFLAGAVSRLKSPAPAVLSVTSAMPKAEEAYRRDVPLKQVILYGDPADPVWTQYRGHPCPRVFRLRSGRITWISPSPAAVSADRDISALAEELGIDYEPGSTCASGL